MEEKGKKKELRNRSGKALLGCLVLLLLSVGSSILVAGYLGFVPPISKLMGTDKPRDLGIKYANVDTAKLYETLGMKALVTKSLTLSKTAEGFLLKGEVPLIFSLTDEELTALINNSRGNDLFSNVQIKIGQNNTVEVSALLMIGRVVDDINASNAKSNSDQKKLWTPVSALPIYVKTKLSVEGGIAKVTPMVIEIGRLSIPSFLLEKVSPKINEGANSLVNSIDNISIKTLTFSDGKLNFEGSLSLK